MTVSHLDSLKSLSQRTNLVHLDEDRVGCAHLDTLLQELGVGHEQVVTYELAPVAYLSGELHPVLPVVLIQTVLDRVDRISVDEVLKESDLLLGREFLAVRILLLAVLELLVVVVPLAIFLNSELRSSAVHSNLHVLAWLVACSLDGIADDSQSVLNTVESRSETTLITYCSGEATLLEQLGEIVEHLSTHADSLLDAGGTNRTDHELLECDRSVGVSTTVDDVHHWNWKSVSVATTDVAVERQTECVGSGFGSGERNTKDGVGTELALSGSAIESDHLVVEGALIEHTITLECGSDDGVDILNSLQNAFAQVAVLVAIAEFKSLVLTCRSTRWHSCTTENTIFQNHIYFNCRVTT